MTEIRLLPGLPLTHTPADPAEEAWLLIAEVSALRTGRWMTTAAELGLTAVQARALVAVDPHIPAAMGVLGSALCIDRASLTELVDHLEHRGYLERRASPQDRRVKVLAVTSAGATARERLIGALTTPDPGLGRLPAEQLDTIATALRRVLAESVSDD
ncbi:MarR family winged helix-turn-helix transcriptional regulator [Nonomuraea basaltis]|uniref:MarR family winged helix-turn-helix transcriptional regulator n=1 Tax=Nonomuraea basaltis TaxID=2495887 RepID=UPI00110C53C5|nr:MarR family transcriptional regulator [Nonomuraea basaltis]TMR88826.1 MarR family transcriptional regulator [Nonomuraea basaltis]